MIKDNIKELGKILEKIDLWQNKIIVEKHIYFNDKEYPITQWNLDKIKEYTKTKNTSFLEEMKDFSLEF